MRILLVDTSQYHPSSLMCLEALEELSKEKTYHLEFFDLTRFLRPMEHAAIVNLRKEGEKIKSFLIGN